MTQCHYSAPPLSSTDRVIPRFGRLVFALLLIPLFFFTSCGTNPEDDLIIEDIVIGTGDEATTGSFLTVHYVGTLLDGRVFDSSRDRRVPFNLVLGARQVIRGWELGMQGMRVGGIRRLTIPPELGYGNSQVGNIPPNSTLVFEIELLSLR